MKKLHLKKIISMMILGCGIVGCTSYQQYSYAVEGQPKIFTPTDFPDSSDYNAQYEDNVVNQKTTFLNSFWFGNNLATVDTSSQNFNLVSAYNIKYLKGNNDSTVLVVGYASELGTANLNKKLSLKRAMYIQNYLIANGVNKSQIKAVGYGSSSKDYPELADKNNPSNRRVDIVYKTSPPNGYISNGKYKPTIELEQKSLEVTEVTKNSDDYPQNKDEYK